MSSHRTTRIRQHTFVVAFGEPQAEAIELLARELGVSPETVIRNAVLKELEPKTSKALPAAAGQLARRITQRRHPSQDPLEHLLG